MNALTFLKRDHRRVERLFRSRAAAGPRAGSRRASLTRDICRELTVHAQLEEEIFYPALREGGVPGDQVAEALEEHRVAKGLISEIEASPADHEKLEAKVEVLREAIRHHIEEEESELFPTTRRTLDAATLVTLGDRMEARKRTVVAPMASIGGTISGLIHRAIETLTPARGRSGARGKAAVEARRRKSRTRPATKPAGHRPGTRDATAAPRPLAGKKVAAKKAARTSAARATRGKAAKPATSVQTARVKPARGTVALVKSARGKAARVKPARGKGTRTKAARIERAPVKSARKKATPSRRSRGA